jgi:16S rRNA (cytosine1402-N4)-methyltransferase
MPRPPRRFRTQRSTPQGEHRPVLLDEVLKVLSPQPGHVVVDCTTGWAGHSVEILRLVGPTGRLLAFDFDPDNLPRARERLEAVGHSFTLHHGNFAGLANVLATEGITAVDAVLADLGMSSMQVDDTERGFSYVRDGPLDMRMDRSRGRTAAQLLATISETDLREALVEFGDEPHAARIARAIVASRQKAPLERTSELARVIRTAVEGDASASWKLHPEPGKWNLHPAARTFQALRILVNRELGNLEQLLRVLPTVLKPAGHVAIISFHSGEDRRIKAAFREGHALGIYSAVSPEPVRPSFAERTANPRARSAKMRWARRT